MARRRWTRGKRRWGLYGQHYGRWWKRVGRRRSYKRTYRWRSRRSRGYFGTRSKVVKLMATVSFTFYERTAGVNGTSRSYAFQFSPAQLQGFTDYFSTYAEFRMVKAQFVLPVNPDAATATDAAQPQVAFIRRVSSRPFITNSSPTQGTTGLTNAVLAPPIATSLLEQSKFGKLYTPKDTTNALRFSFYPYTLGWQARPIVGLAGTYDGSTYPYLTYQSARRWVPFSFLGATKNPTTIWDDVSFYGPYLIPYSDDMLAIHPPSSDTNPGATTWTRNVQLTVWCQFRGQR